MNVYVVGRRVRVISAWSDKRPVNSLGLVVKYHGARIVDVRWDDDGEVTSTSLAHLDLIPAALPPSRNPNDIETWLEEP